MTAPLTMEKRVSETTVPPFQVARSKVERPCRYRFRENLKS